MFIEYNLDVPDDIDFLEVRYYQGFFAKKIDTCSKTLIVTLLN